MACDICGKRGCQLVDLLDSHKTAEIHQVCDECRQVLDVHKRKLQAVTTNILLDWFKRFMNERRATHQGGAA